MWVLVLSIAVAPAYALETHRSEHKSEAACKRSMAQAMQLLEREGIVLIAKCEPKK